METDDGGDVDGVDESGVATCTRAAIVYRMKKKGEGEVGRKGGARLFRLDLRARRVMRDFIY